MTLQWIDILVRSSLLGMHVLAKSLQAARGDQPPAVGEFYLTLWQQVVSVLGSLLAAGEEACLAVRSRFVPSFVKHIFIILTYTSFCVQSFVGRSGDCTRSDRSRDLRGRSVRRGHLVHSTSPNVRETVGSTSFWFIAVP